MYADEPMVFALNSSRAFAERVAAVLGIELSPHEEQEYPDGEHRSRPRESVQHRDVFVIQSLHADSQQSVNDKLCRLLFFVGALRDASAARITAVIPYLCYARLDQRVRPRDPVTTRYVAHLFETAGVDRIVVLDVHDLAAFQNAFSIPANHLQATPLFVRYFASLMADEDVVVVSPDVGGIKRAERFQESFARELGRPVAGAFLTKHRVDGVVHDVTSLAGTIEGRTVLIFDDMISTGSTVQRAVLACQKSGAERIFVAATHGLFVANADTLMADPRVTRLVVTDSVRPFGLDEHLESEKLVVLESAPLFAEAIRSIHGGVSVPTLLEV